MSEELILFTDIETNGLDLEKHKILEVAFVLTDINLQPISSFTRVVLPSYAPDVVGTAWDKDSLVDQAYEDANDYVRQMHTDNGLWKALRGPDSILLEQAQAEVMSWFVELVKPPQEGQESVKPLLGGASVHFDRKFEERYFSYLLRLCHHRCFDVSTLKRMCEWWTPQGAATYGGDAETKVESDHRALSDITYTIAEAESILNFLQKRLEPAE